MSDTPDSNNEPEEEQQLEIEQQHLNAGLAEQFAEEGASGGGEAEEPDRE